MTKFSHTSKHKKIKHYSGVLKINYLLYYDTKVYYFLSIKIIFKLCAINKIKYT